MAFAYISEYIVLARDGVGTAIPAGMEPAIAVQKIAIGVGSIQSAAFNAQTKFICVNADAPCSFKIGANPTATASDMRIPLDGTQYFGVNAGDKIAIITNT